MFEIARRVRFLVADIPTPFALFWSRRYSSGRVPTGSFATPAVSDDAALTDPSGAPPGASPL